ncbi:hypothetical protein, partial [Plasticicumulans sp.]|uniref:hypothetical protein n=1 Tax=Plasticicumulans sp. TaxID=2307179 RepID=UPI003220A166
MRVMHVSMRAIAVGLARSPACHVFVRAPMPRKAASSAVMRTRVVQAIATAPQAGARRRRLQTRRSPPGAVPVAPGGLRSAVLQAERILRSSSS